MTKVVNKKTSKFDVYIGRKQDTKFHFGNPWSHHPEDSVCKDVFKAKDRAESIENFRKWLEFEDFLSVQPERRNWILANLDKLKDKRIACFCKPLACHGDILARMADNL